MLQVTDPRQRQLFKNVIYVGALSALLDIEMEVLKGIIEGQFQRKQKLIAPNFKALSLGESGVGGQLEPHSSLAMSRL